MKKVDVEYLKFLWPMRHYLVTCGSGERANVLAVSFCMPVSKEPPMVACAIGTKAHSNQLIRDSRELVVNVPTRELARQVAYCGFHSGRDVKKFATSGLTPLPGRHVGAPIVGECVAHMECRVEQIVDCGDKTLFVATVLDAYADEELASGRRAVDYPFGEFPVHVYGTRFAQGGGTNG